MDEIDAMAHFECIFTQMKILVTGSNGLVGSHVVAQLLQDGYEVFASSRTGDLSSFNAHVNYRFIQADFSDPYAIHDAFEFVKPDVVVHCGAMSRPDDCERNQAAAYDTNVYGTVQLLLNAAESKAFFIYLSTDFIFDGKQGMYTEDDQPNPLSYYGKTKLEAEEAVKEYECNWAIVRTVFVYAKPLYGRNSFITMIAEKIKKNESFNVANDQERTPVHAADLAKGISAMIQKKATGVYNICGNEVLTPYQMAIAAARYLGASHHRLVPVTQNELKEIAERPLKSGLCINKATSTLGFSPMNFDEGLKKILGE